MFDDGTSILDYIATTITAIMISIMPTAAMYIWE